MGKTSLAARLGLGWVLLAAACLPALPHGRARAPNTNVPASYGEPADATNSARLKSREFFADLDDYRTSRVAKAVER